MSQRPPPTPLAESPDVTDVERTLIDMPALDLAQTAAVSARSGAATVTDAASQTLPGRTTVLPRVDFSGGRPRLERPSRDRYEEGGVLGRGGIGEVVHAVDHDIGRPVAVKRLLPERVGPADLARFVEEIRLVGALEHPHIVPIHDVGVDAQGAYYFVMKYVAGETLADIIARLDAGDPEYHRRWPHERRVDLFLQILEAIAYAHAHGILHRDIKPANVLVTPEGNAVVVDWGLAAPMHAATSERDALLAGALDTADAADAGGVHQTSTGPVLGTPLYMSPEQARGEPLDARTDVYSLSVMFHELLTLRHYLRRKTDVVSVLAGVLIEDPPIAVFQRHPHQPPVPPELAWFLRDGLHKERERRYPSVQSMIDRLHMRASGIIPIQCHATLTKRMMLSLVRLIDRFPIGFTVAFTGAALALLAMLVTLVVLLVRA